MRYYYVPSTYRGRKFGRGFAGGNFRGCGRICGGSLVGLSGDSPTPSAPPIEIPVQPVQVEENLLAIPDITDEMIERARKIIAYAEATGRAKPITKKEASLWSGIKNLGSKTWNATKNAAVAVATNPVVRTAVKYGLPLAMNAVMPVASSYLQGAITNALAPKEDEALSTVKRYFSDLPKEDILNAYNHIMDDPELSKKYASPNKPAESTGLWGSLKKWWSGSGYRAGAYRAGAYRAGAYRAGAYRGGKLKLKKGSLEAKLYMARLRAMRGKSKKRSGKKGGMFRGVTRADIRALLDADKNSPTITVNWTDKNDKPHTTKVLREKAENMIRATNDLVNYYKYKNKDENGEWSGERTPEEIKAFRKENWEAEGRKSWKKKDGKYKRWGAKRNRILMRQLEDITGDNRKKKWDDMIAYWKERSDPKLFNYIFAKTDEKKKIRKGIKDSVANMTKLLEQRMVELNIKSNIVDNIADAVDVADEAAGIAQDAAAGAPAGAKPAAQAAADAAALNAQQAKQAVTTQQAVNHAQAAVDAADTAVKVVKSVDGITKKSKGRKKKKRLEDLTEDEIENLTDGYGPPFSPVV